MLLQPPNDANNPPAPNQTMKTNSPPQDDSQ